MKKTLSSYSLAPLVFILAAFYVNSALAANHALLIGIGRYPHLADRQQLEGPPHDVAALERMLTVAWGFEPENIAALVDGQAGKGRITR
ncbi:MAG: hypothetical protein AB1641_31645 [Thermodesulfobacteriota bacterium]